MKNPNINRYIEIFLFVILVCLIAVFANLLISDKHVHSYDEWTLEVNPTCTSEGLRKCYCFCGAVQTCAVAASGHDYITVEGLPATCTESGHMPYVQCSRCEYSTFVEIMPLGHSYGEWFLSRAATCAEFGEEKRVCARDESHFEVRATGKTPHTMSDWTVKKAASCTQDGTEVRTCSVCLTEETKAIPMTGHLPSGWIIEEEATCTQDGTEYRQCANCLKCLEKRTVQATGHSFGQWFQSVAPSCVSFGEEKRICAHDATHVESRVIEKSEHIPSQWLTDNEPSCEVEGLRHIECLTCKTRLEQQILPVFGHSFETLYDSEKHYSLCTRCNLVKDSSAHIWGDNQCKVCNYDAGGIKGLEWLLDGNYYTLTGLGNVNIGEITVPETHNGKMVTAVGAYAFNNFDGTSIIIPDSIERIEKGALSGCNVLKSLIIPFIGCDSHDKTNLGFLFGGEDNSTVPRSLKEVQLTGVTYIADSAFKDCKFISQIILPDTVEVIGEESFYGCIALESIELPESLKIINDTAFWNCQSLKQLIIPAGVQQIGVCALFVGNDTIEITFINKEGWSVYDGDKKVADVISENIADELKKYALNTWKRTDKR